MDKTNRKKQLREIIRILERKLGLLTDNEMSCCHITLAQCHAMVEIGRAKKISLIDLSNLLNLDTSTLSRTVNNLVKSELVERLPGLDDRRYVTISLTPKGLNLFNGIENDMDSHYSEIYDLIPEDKRLQVIDSLEILVEVFNKIKCC